MAKAAFNKKKTLFTCKLNLNLRKKLVKCIASMDTSESRSEIPGTF